jgi:hypothetical protein
MPDIITAIGHIFLGAMPIWIGYRLKQQDNVRNAARLEQAAKAEEIARLLEISENRASQERQLLISLMDERFSGIDRRISDLERGPK